MTRQCRSPFRLLRWVGDIDGHLELLDQTRLPAETVYLECRTVEDVWQAIKRLSVRGAPAIGVAAAYGVCVGVSKGELLTKFAIIWRRVAANGGESFFGAGADAKASRAILGPERSDEPSPSPSLKGRGIALATDLLAEARAIDHEDRAYCAAMGRHGADLFAHLPQGSGILTHCNAGALFLAAATAPRSP